MENKQFRAFGVTVGGIFALLGCWPVLWRGEAPRLWSLGLAGALLLPALLAPGSLKYPYRLWMRLGHLLGRVNTRVLLGVIFYGVFTPVAWVLRLRGNDPMQRRLDPTAVS
jgi:hypothetical protein